MSTVLRLAFLFLVVLALLSLSACSERLAEEAAPPANSPQKTPIPLTEWRSIQTEGQEVVEIEDIDERIARSYSFVLRYPKHDQTRAVLKTLTESLVTRGDYDTAELVDLLAHRVRLDPKEIEEPLRLVRNFHLKYGLPLNGALALIDEVRERIRWAEAEVAYEPIKFQREFERSKLQSQQVDAYVMEARLYLSHGLYSEALAATEEALAISETVTTGLVPTGEGAAFQTGEFDALYLVRAAALEGLGQRQHAREVLSQSFGALDDPDLSDLYEHLRRTVGLWTGSEISVKAEPEVAFAFELQTLDGETIRLADYRGRVVLLAFWATWCGPCREEIPALQDFAREHQDLGVEVLTINIDRYAKEDKVRRFIEQFEFEAPILMEDEKQLETYNYWAIPTLYVIDRDGNIAYKRTGFDPALDDKLARDIARVAEDTAETGRDLLSIELAPPGFGVRWQVPHQKFGALALVPATGSQTGEVVVADNEELLRWSSEGTELDPTRLTRWVMKPRAVDLDGDGQLEWVGVGFEGLTVVDWSGRMFWQRGVEFNATLIMSGMAVGAAVDNIAGIRDLNGDGFKEIVISDRYRVIAIQNTRDPLWTSRAFPGLETAIMGPHGEIIVQAQGTLYDIDPLGNASDTGRRAPEGRVLRGRVATPEGMLDLFGGTRDVAPLLGFDIDADGEQDIVVPTHQGIAGYTQYRGMAAYAIDGTPILRVRGHDQNVQIAVGDLDGQPGDEIAVYLSNYGLVVLGYKA